MEDKSGDKLWDITKLVIAAIVGGIVAIFGRQ